MPRLSVYEQPGRQVPVEHIVAPGRLMTHLEQLYPQGFSGAVPYYYHTPPQGSTKLLTDQEALELNLKPDDVVYCLLQPRGPLGTVSVALIIASVVASILIFALISPARRHDSDDSDDQSDRAPDLKTQNNLIREGTRIPDAFGSLRIFPSLATDGYVIHDGEEQELTELFVVGRGKYRFEAPKLGDSLISDLTGATFERYGPNQRLPNDLRTVRRNRNIENLTLRPPDEVVKQSDVTFISGSNRIELAVDIADELADEVAFRVDGSNNNDGVYTPIGSGGTGPYWVDVEENLNDETTTGVVFETPKGGKLHVLRAVDDYKVRVEGDTVTGYYPWQQIVQSGGGTVRIKSGALKAGDKVAFDFPDEHGLLQAMRCTSVSYSEVIEESADGQGATRIEVATWVFRTLSGQNPNWPLLSLSTGSNPSWLRLQELDFDKEITGGTTSEPNWTEYYTVGSESTPIDELWFTYGFPRGLWQQKAGDRRSKITITVDVEYQQVDSGLSPIGTLYTDQLETRSKSRETLRFTQRYKLPSSGIWRVRWRRLQNSRPDESDRYYEDDTRIYDLAGAVKIPRRQFQGVTTIVLRQKSNESLSGLSSRRLNVVYTRLLQRLQPDGSLGSALEPTKRMSDAIIYTATTDGKYSLSNIDLQGLAAIQNDLDTRDGGDQGLFSHVFTRTISVDDQIQTIADVARCVVYRTLGQKLFFARDEVKAEPGSGLYCRRNMFWESYKRTFGFQNSSSPDGITLKWIDAVEDYAEREYTYPADTTPKRPRRMTVAGIATWAQVYRRARFEYDNLIYAVDSLDIKVTEEGQLQVPHDMIRVEDIQIHRFRAGEILSYDVPSKTLKLDRVVTFEAPALVYTVVLRHPEGTQCEEIEVSQGVQGDELVCATHPTVPILGGDEQLRTLFCFGARDGHMAERWSVSGAKVERDGVKLSLVNYDPARFASDSVPLPSKPEL